MKHIATNESEALYPDLWRGLVGVWEPSAGSPMTVPSYPNRLNDGTLDGSAFTTTQFRNHRAMTFSGSNGVACKTAHTSQDIKGYTFMAWIKGSSAAATQFLMDKQTSTNVEPMAIYFSSGSLVNQYFNSGTHYYTLYTTAVLTGVWVHVACTRKPGVEMLTYVNGKKVTVTVGVADGGQTVTATGALTIGRRPTINDGFVGSMADVRLYNRPLSPVEIRMSYEGATPLMPAPRWTVAAPVAAPPTPSGSSWYFMSFGGPTYF